MVSQVVGLPTIFLPLERSVLSSEVEMAGKIIKFIQGVTMISMKCILDLVLVVNQDLHLVVENHT
jgi:hypothetical protein